MKTKVPISPIDEGINQVKADIAARRKTLAWLLKHKSTLAKANAVPKFWSGMVDFDQPDRASTLAIIRAIGGRWVKNPSTQGGRVDYTTKLDGKTVRIWAGEPPPSCKIVEREVHVPAHTEIIRELVCPKNTLAAA
jgi:hypothetical protein